MAVTIDLPLEPIGKGRPRIGKYGAFTPQKTREWEKEAAFIAGEQMRKGQLKVICSPVHVEMTAYFKPASTWPEWKVKAALDGSIVHVAKPDVDNIFKACLDALEDVVIDDDKLVRSLFGEKLYRADPGVVLVFYPLTGAPCTVKNKKEFSFHEVV